MCGIAGFISRNSRRSDNENELILDTMCKAIVHRGPDEQGMTVKDGIALGMRRLSIIDVKTGQQPIFNSDNSLAIVFNGEIYNYAELKADLESKGYAFKTNSDTETILLAYQEYGEEAVKKLRGMFAFAIYDFRNESLFIARDRIGKKPLFYSFTNDGAFVFGSEIKALQPYPGIDMSMDLNALASYLTFGYVPENQCIFQNISKLLPGHYLKLDRGGKFSTERYWDFEQDRSELFYTKSENVLIEELRCRLREAVKVRMISEVPLGAFLSGGVDSSAVVALMSEVSSYPVKTFSIGFNEDSHNELKFARIVAEHFDTEHHEFIVTPDLTDIVDDIAWHFDEPFADPSSLPTYMVSKLAREHVTVALSGDGGDELFGGYTRYVEMKRRSAFAFLPKAIRKAIEKLATSLPHSAKGKYFLYNISQDRTDQYIDLVSHFNKVQRRSLFSKELAFALDTDHSIENEFSKILNTSGSSDLLEKIMYLDIRTYLPSDIMTKVDRMTMANSLESRAPLLDKELVSFAANIPLDMKIRGNETKYILKKSMEGILPNEILYREKQGFGVPIEEWINNQLSSRIRETILGGWAISSGYLNKAYIETILEEHRTKRRDHSYSLWMLFMFEMWSSKYQSIA